jgi:hypothetical protein
VCAAPGSTGVSPSRYAIPTHGHLLLAHDPGIAEQPQLRRVFVDQAIEQIQRLLRQHVFGLESNELHAREEVVHQVMHRRHRRAEHPQALRVDLGMMAAKIGGHRVDGLCEAPDFRAAVLRYLRVPQAPGDGGGMRKASVDATPERPNFFR